MDPQQRLFLECAWEALEHAGYDPRRYRGAVGVFAGASLSTYLLRTCCASAGALADRSATTQAVHRQRQGLPDHRASSYKLDLRGPSVAVQTACSTSLVAVHLAAAACSTASATWRWPAASSIRVPQQRAATSTARAASRRRTATAARSTRRRAGHGVRQRRRRGGAQAAGRRAAPTATRSTP